MTALAYLKTSTIVVIILLSIAFIGGVGYLTPFWAWVSNFFVGDDAAVTLALVSSFNNVGGMIGPYIIGVLAGDSSVKIGQVLLFVVSSHLVYSFCFFGLAKYFARQQTLTLSEDSLIFTDPKVDPEKEI